jgi:EAL domain-containing protein (putative c-di-GMP-specific phosphodiesterase class I)
VPIGQWVLETACRQARQWQQLGLGLTHVSVNLSSVQFNQIGLSEQVAEILRSSHLPAEFLVLEVTETALMQDAEVAIATLHQLKALGIRLAIDDFGTGYSSLSYLKKLPIDILKIDNCFVRGLVSDLKNQVILKAAIQMGHDLNLTIVAEGVETEAEQAFLNQLHCDFVQGFLIGKPMPRSALEVRLNQQQMSIKFAEPVA